MAVITPTFTNIVGPTGGVDALIIKWGPIGDSDTCVGVKRPDLADRSFQVEGTFNGATIQCQGSNDSIDGSNGSGNWRQLSNPSGTAIGISTSGAIQQVTEATLWIRPSTSGGTSSSLTVTVCARRSVRGG